MELMANDLSIHDQFHDVESFRNALARLMAMHASARRFDREVYCHRALLNAHPIPGMPMRQALNRLSTDERRSAMLWLARAGPFWDDLRRHGDDDLLECRGDIVTDSAVGEAAFRTMHGVECGLISVTPSEWDYSPVDVIWRREADHRDDRTTALENWRDATTLEESLREAASPILSWDDLRESSAHRFESLTFAADCFEPLSGVPFARSAAERFLVLLDILDRFVRAFDAAGVRTQEGQRIYRDYFTGDRALFSDSSDAEKRKFRRQLTFSHPGGPDGSLFCPWHGKVLALDAPPPLLLAHRSGKAGVYRVRRPEDHQPVTARWRLGNQAVDRYSPD